jgi:glycosyltransferase involved in cell wall biosynthesis
MRISVVIPTFNSEKWIGKCLAGFTTQTLPPDEVIVVDGRSTDKTTQIIRKKKGVTLLVDKEDNTAGSSRNLGAKNTKSDIIVFCDSDCIPDSRLLEYHYESYKKRKDITGVKGTVRPISKTNVSLFVQKEVMRNQWFGNLNIDGTVKNQFGSSNFSINRKQFLKKPFREDLTSAEDVEFSIRILDEGKKILFEPRAVVHHHHPVTLGELFEQRKWWGEGWYQLTRLDFKEIFQKKFGSTSFFQRILSYANLPTETLKKGVLFSKNLLCEECNIGICRILDSDIDPNSEYALNQVICIGLASGVLKKRVGLDHKWAEK